MLDAIVLEAIVLSVTIAGALVFKKYFIKTPAQIEAEYQEWTNATQRRN